LNLKVEVNCTRDGEYSSESKANLFYCKHEFFVFCKACLLISKIRVAITKMMELAGTGILQNLVHFHIVALSKNE